VVEAHEMEDGGVIVMHVHRVAGDLDAVIVGFAMGDSAADAGAGGCWLMW
jgi:hypothetical protein